LLWAKKPELSTERLEFDNLGMSHRSREGEVDVARGDGNRLSGGGPTG